MKRAIPDACPKCGSDPEFRGTLGSSYECGSWVKTDGSRSFTKRCHARDRAKAEFAQQGMIAVGIGFIVLVITGVIRSLLFER